MRTVQNAADINVVHAVAAPKSFYPRGTLKCEGSVSFRSQAARDVACLLDLDAEVRSWRCNPPALLVPGGSYVCDFLVSDVHGGETLVDAPDRQNGFSEADIKLAAERGGFSFRQTARDEVYGGTRLRNARDLLRYANYSVPLGDRLKLLAALEEHGTLTVAECLTAFSETRPIGGFASMVLNGFLEVDLDDGLIGPGTAVRRITD